MEAPRSRRLCSCPGGLRCAGGGQCGAGWSIGRLLTALLRCGRAAVGLAGTCRKATGRSSCAGRP